MEKWTSNAIQWSSQQQQHQQQQQQQQLFSSDNKKCSGEEKNSSWNSFARERIELKINEEEKSSAAREFVARNKNTSSEL